MKRWSVLVLFLAAALAGCQTPNSASVSGADPYTPKLCITVTNDFSGRPETAYRFTQDQLARMSRTKLETNRVVRYLEDRWPVQRLRAYCVATNTWPEGHQNLVAHNCPVETELQRGKIAGFDRIWVYVDEDDGHSTYVGETGTKWHRWTYSLNVKRGPNHWAIIEQLPNEFMDSARYSLSEPSGPANGSQPIRSETNRTSSAAGSRRSP